MHAEFLLQLDVIDHLIEEPLGGAHHNTQEMYKNVKEYVSMQWNALKEIPPEILIEQRYQKFRRMGKFAVEENSSI